MNDYITHTVNLQPLTKSLEDALRDGKMDIADEIAEQIENHVMDLRLWLFERNEVSK